MLVQWAINTTYSSAIKMTPYEATYGQKPRVGIAQLPMDPEFLQRIVTERELADVLHRLGYATSSLHALN